MTAHKQIERPDTKDSRHADLVRALTKPGADILKHLTPERADAIHMAIGVAGEAGELLDGVRALQIHRPISSRNSLSVAQQAAMVNVIEELGDIEFYLEGLRSRYGVQRIDLVRSVRMECPVLDAVAGIVVASAALLDTVKKEVIYNKPINLASLADYMGDLEGHLAELRESLCISRSETLDEVWNKLGKRYASGSYSDQQAQQRLDKQTTE